MQDESSLAFSTSLLAIRSMKLKTKALVEHYTYAIQRTIPMLSTAVRSRHKDIVDTIPCEMRQYSTNVEKKTFFAVNLEDASSALHG